MSTAIQIQISEEPTSDIVHRFRNFGEEVYLDLKDICSVDIDEVDASTTSFTIRNIRRRDLGEVTQTIKRRLKKHHFDQSATLIRL